MLKRKIDKYLSSWKDSENKKPLIISGARQIGKTTSIRQFGKTYKSFIEINFVNEPKYKSAFDEDFSVDSIIKKLSLLNPNFKFIEKNTLIFLDEIQDYPNAVTSLKFFCEDARFDVVCSGLLLGVHYNKISSIPVGFKENYIMHSLDFEEFLWAKGYKEEQIDDIFSYMRDLKPLPEVYINVLNNIYKEYIFVGGMPECVQNFITKNTFEFVFKIQDRIYRDYEDDITKYVVGLDNARVKNYYRHIVKQLARDNHKFQITKIGHGARSRDYSGVEDWLKDAGLINISYNLEELSLPFSSYEDDSYFRIYFSDHSLFISSLDEESKEDIIVNSNYEIYNGALYESLISESLVKQGIEPYFYKNNDSTIELDFIIRVKNEIIPIEVKKKNGRTKSLNKILENKVTNYGVKLVNGNIGYENNKFTFPYFLSFLIKRFFKETNYISWNDNDK